MSTTTSILKLGRGFAATAIAAGALLLVPEAASAGSCPPQHVTKTGQKPGPAAHKGVTDKILSMIPLAQEKVGLKEHSLRLRRLVIQPGGIVAWHDHGDRPAIIYIVSGTISEYSSHCAVPIVHRAGESTAESGGLMHWWQNHSKRPVVLLSADLLHDHTDKNM